MTAHITVSCYCEVEADNENEAIEKAAGLGAAIGGVNSGNSPDKWWIIEEADGTPENIKAEEVDLD